MEPSIPLIRRCDRNSNLQAHFRFFEDNATATHSGDPSGPEHFESIFTWDAVDNKNTTTHSEYSSGPEHFESAFTWDAVDNNNKNTTTRPEESSGQEHFESTFTWNPVDPTYPCEPASSAEAARRPVFSDLGVPTICVSLPLTLLAALITGLVIFGKQRISYDGSFGETALRPMSRFFTLVNVSNSWLLSLSSVTSTVAGYMAPVIMVLQMYLNAQAVEKSSSPKNQDPDRLLTPYQLSLMLGLSSGSLERWWRFERYARATTNKIPFILRRTVSTLKWSLLLSTFIVIADQVFHYTTTTVQISQATETSTLSTFGRGLTEECLSLKREDNYGWPCSLDEALISKNLTEFVAQQNQIFFLHQGISKVSNIELVDAWENGTRLALLTPQDVSANVDFRASTIGVSAHCRPITTDCALRPTGPQGSYASFNCSESFWGVLNKTPLSDNDASAIDPDVPPLAFKASKNLQFGFFSDSGLKIPYNTVGLNPSTGFRDGTTQPMPDPELINPIFFAIAGSFSTSSELAGVDLSTDPSFWSLNSGPGYLSFILSCSYQTLEVEYTSLHGKLKDFSVTTTSNGSIAEIYHGFVQRSSTGVPDVQLQLMLETAALQPSGLALAKTWADLFSKHVLGVIGAFTSPRTNLKEQSQEKILVTKLSIPALVVLLVLNLSYLPLGLYLYRKAYKQASETDLRDLFRRLSVPGVITCQFNDVISWKGISSKGFDEKEIIEEGVRVQAKRDPEQGFQFAAVWEAITNR